MSDKKQFYIGLSLGIFTAFIISLIVFLTSNPGFSVADYFNIFVNGKILSPILSIALVGNLALFFLFLKFDKDLISKGILAATMVVGVLIFIMKFL
ncbi:MAG: hypothetical protein ACKOXF_02130 [Chitinophagaceae bacterium]